MRVIVTGASSGIGKAIYDRMKNTEWHPCWDGKGHEVRSLQPGDAVEVVGVSRRGPDAFVDFMVEEAGFFARVEPCDVLILNHGVMHFDELGNVEKLVNTNLLSYWHALNYQAVHTGGGHPVKRGGCIILNASVSGVVGDKDVPLYAALKAGVINLVRSYAQILQPQGIRVNSISPGFFKTNLVMGDPPQELIDTIPMGRQAEAHEILPVIDYLIDSKYTNGENLIIDGGLTL